MRGYSVPTEQVASVDQMVQLLVAARYLQLETLNPEPQAERLESYRAMLITSARDLVSLVVQLGATYHLARCDICEFSQRNIPDRPQWLVTVSSSPDDSSLHVSSQRVLQETMSKLKKRPKSCMRHPRFCATLLPCSRSLWARQRFSTRRHAYAGCHDPSRVALRPQYSDLHGTVRLLIRAAKSVDVTNEAQVLP